MTEMASRERQGQSGQTLAQAQQKVQEKAQDVRGQVSSRVRDQVGTRSTQAGEQASSIADALRRTGTTLREEGNDAPARVTDTVAERADRLGSYLRESDADAILRDVENFARRQPWLVAAGGFAIGLFASRFLKASSGGRYRSQWDVGSMRAGSRRDAEPEIAFEPDDELDSPVGARHGT